MHEANRSVLATKRPFSLILAGFPCVFDTVPAQHPTRDNPFAYPYGHLLLFLHQYRSLVTCILRKKVLLSSNGRNFLTVANMVTKFAAYVA